jgi:hypothetical protein
VVVVQLAAQTHPSKGELISSEDFFGAIVSALHR